MAVRLVGFTTNKDDRKTESNGWAQSVASAGGMPPPAGAGRWKVWDNTKWVEQTGGVELFFAAQAREWAARHAQQVGVPCSSKQDHLHLCPRSVLVLMFSLLIALATC